MIVIGIGRRGLGQALLELSDDEAKSLRDHLSRKYGPYIPDRMSAAEAALAVERSAARAREKKLLQREDNKH